MLHRYEVFSDRSEEQSQSVPRPPGARDSLCRVTIDRPFLFLIRDIGVGTALFLGRVMDPS